MKIKRNRSSKKGRIEIIPMIDVMFFLLATFILASLSMQRVEGIPVNLVEGKSDQIEVEKKITLTITYNNGIYLGNREIKLPQIFNEISRLKPNPKTPVIIACDKNASQGVVMQVMLAAKAAGAKSFSMITKSR